MPAKERDMVEWSLVSTNSSPHGYMYGRVKLLISFEELSLSIMGSRGFVEEAAWRRFLLLLQTYFC
jgi:hypothetical protein